MPAGPGARTALVQAGLGKGREAPEPAGTLWNTPSPPPLAPQFPRSLLILGNIFNQQPSYYSDLDESMPTILQVPALARPGEGDELGKQTLPT